MSNQVKYALVLILTGILLIWLGERMPEGEELNISKLQAHTKAVLRQKEEVAQLALNKLADFQQKSLSTAEFFGTDFKLKGITLMVFDHDTLNYWSDNSVAVEPTWKNAGIAAGLIKLKNGWYQALINQGKQGTRLVALILIKQEFAYQNSYLQNGFQIDFGIPDGVRLIKTKNGFELSGDAIKEPKNLMAGSYLSLLGLIFLMVGVFIGFFGNKLLPAWVKVSLLGTILLGVRFAIGWLKVPKGLFTLGLFQPQLYSTMPQWGMESLGLVLLNTLFILAFFLALTRLTHGLAKEIKFEPKALAAIVIMLVTFSLAYVINIFLVNLIENSKISFNINSILALTAFSYWGLLIIALLQLAFYLAVNVAVGLIMELQLTFKTALLSLIIATVVFLLTFHFFGVNEWIFIAKPLTIGGVLFLFKNRTPRLYPFTELIAIVFLFSVYSAYTLIKDSNEQEVRSRINLADGLASDEDAVTENLFADLDEEIRTDTILPALLKHPNKNATAFEKHLRQEYFSGYWDKYKIKLSVFDSICQPLLKSSITRVETNDYYEDLLLNDGTETSVKDLFFMKKNHGKMVYLAKIPLYKHLNDSISMLHANPFATLFVEMDAQLLVEENGFPELLLDRKVNLNEELSNYSYAKYKNGILNSQYGKYKYSRFIDHNQYVPKKIQFEESDGYSHLFFASNGNSLIILSKPLPTLLDTVTSFSYLFGFFSIIALLTVVAQQAINGKLFKQNSFQYRIQFFLVLIVLLSLAFFGLGTVFYIRQQFETKNRERISEKINSAAAELESALGDELKFNNDRTDYTVFLLRKLSSIFTTDANVFDLDGTVYASSQPKLFEEGVMSKKMDPLAFKEMMVKGKTQFVHEENVGSLRYLSAYVPLKGKNGELIAFLNLPYFSKQTELEKEISGFLMALINIYVLLFALSILLAIVISGYITRPLRLIQDKLSKIQLGGKNEPIDWKERDEIGNLIKEYNRMIEELAHSAELLAKSERETAWREMAKQVAHEIKNPLTPMRLSIQHLERMWSDKSPDIDNQLPRISKMLVDQIDTLTSIADAFSNFASMPKVNATAFDLKELVENTVDLFRKSSSTQFTFNGGIEGECLIRADREQLLRVLNNIIKNALQAIPLENEGEITIGLSLTNTNPSYYCISIRDNGIGMNEETKEKIFTPNFTTKTTGMGLGLAMCKNIIESNQGNISFETQLGVGTVFYVYLPLS